jgi:hypothetical protein
LQVDEQIGGCVLRRPPGRVFAVQAEVLISRPLVAVENRLLAAHIRCDERMLGSELDLYLKRCAIVPDLRGDDE